MYKFKLTYDSLSQIKIIACEHIGFGVDYNLIKRKFVLRFYNAISSI